MKYLLITLTVLFSVQLYAQEILMDESVEDEETRLPSGPGKDNFGHLYVAYGQIMPFGEAQGAPIRVGLSHYFNIGFRQKYKIVKHYYMGFDVAYSRLDYNIEQSNTKIFPNSVTHDAERYISNNFTLEYYNRINFTDKGDNMGIFLDIGAYGSLAYRNKHLTKDKASFAISNSNVMVVHNTDLDYDNIFNYGVRARLGFRRYVLFGEYRLSDMFDEDFDKSIIGFPTVYPELPRVTIGLQIGLHR